ncbi:MAG: Smr/MutS family protein [Sandaracinus sp.]|nr:Smr/MutS family protein [Myxococcales bacterium]MCB9634381.1 Smr/MutS family protein [Sandaracinus sp.]
MAKKDAGPKAPGKTGKATAAERAPKSTSKAAPKPKGKASKGSPFAALADQVRERKAEAARALVKAKGQATKQAAAAMKQAQEGSKPAEPAAKKAEAKAPIEPLTSEARRKIPEGGPLGQYSYDDRVAFHDAFGDVRPLGAAAPGGQTKKPKASGVHGARAIAERKHRDEAEEVARKRLESLVVGGVSFEVRRDEHGVEAKRKGASDRTLMMILRSELTPEARVDLHGLTRDAAMRVVRQFLKDARARSRLTLLLIHGKGAHSEGGIGVLEEACVEALTKGGSAPYVEAFATAPQKFGGRGAIVVRLRKK